MFSSVGLSTPRGPFAGAAPLALRPLSAIAATIAGGVPQERIQRLIAELIPVLQAVHQQGQICGDISVHSVGLDESGRAHLMALAPDKDPAQRLHSLTAGYAPFELYTESPDWPRGPWTDIYALSAVAYSLVAGQHPPPAAERRVEDTHQPLQTLGLSRYSEDFLRAIDAGLQVLPAGRPQSIQSYAELLALPSPVHAAEPEAKSVEPIVSPALTGRSRRTRRPSWRVVIQAVLLGIATLAVAAYWWGRLTGSPEKIITHSELAVKGPNAGATLSPSVDPEAQATTGGASAPAAELNDTELRIARPPDLMPLSLIALTTHQDNGANTDAQASASPSQQDNAARKAERRAPPPVRVSINVRPWGEIVINGVSRGVTPPLKTVMLRPGKYAVTIRNSAQPPYNTTLVVTAGKPGMISHSFR